MHVVSTSVVADRASSSLSTSLGRIPESPPQTKHMKLQANTIHAESCVSTASIARVASLASPESGSCADLTSAQLFCFFRRNARENSSGQEFRESVNLPSEAAILQRSSRQFPHCSSAGQAGAWASGHRPRRPKQACTLFPHTPQSRRQRS